MKTDDIRKMGLAYVQVLEAGKKTMDPVNPAELKGTHAQRKDKDIDNDGKVDSSDEYLHKRRQAISKSMKKEEVEELDELSNKTVDSYWKKASSQIKDPKTDLKTYDKRVKGLMTVAMKSEEVEQVDEVSKKLLRKVGGTMLRKGLSDDPKADKHMKSANLASAKLYPDQYKNSPLKAKVPATESTEWPVFARIMEKRAEHVKGATPPEPIDSKASQGEKDFVNMHGGLTGNDSGIDGAKAAADTIKAAAAQVKTAPKRPADQTVGDKTMPKPKM